MADNRRTESIDIVAKRTIYVRATGDVGYTFTARRHIYDLTDDDVQAVRDRIREILDGINPGVDEFEAAYAYLADRAKPDDRAVPGD